MYAFIFLLFLYTTVSASPNNETLKARLNYPFFQFFSKNGHHVVDVEIPKITIPSIVLPFSTSVGTGEVSTDELVIDKFRSPHIDFKLSKDGISWATRGGGVKLRGLWAASFTELITVRDSGWLTAIATDIRLNISSTIYQLDGRPQVRIGECTVDIVHLDVQIGGSVISWLVNLFRTPFSGLVKKVVHDQACVAARGIMMEEANGFLHSLPSHIDVGKNFFVDYFLLRNPVATSDYAEFDLSADVVYGNTTCTPQDDHHWTDAGDSPGMITSWLSEAVPNCLLDSAHRGQLVRFVVSKDMPAVSNYLKTSCGIFSICVGKFFEPLRTKYPDQYVDLYFHTYQTPYVEMSRTEGINLNISFAVDLYINPMKTSESEILARLVLDSFSDVKPYLRDGRITGDLLNSTFSVREDFSNIGDISPTFLTTFTSILSVMAKQAVRSVLAVGVPIPSFDNVTLADTTKIDILDGYVRLNVDFEYQ